MKGTAGYGSFGTVICPPESSACVEDGWSVWRPMRCLGVTLGALMVLAAGCSPRPDAAPAGLGALYDRVLSDRPVLVVPGLRWQPDQEKGEWRFRGFASLLVQVEGPQPGELRLRLRPAGATGGFRFRLEWDGEPLAQEAVRWLENGFEVAIDRHLLTPGTHALRLTRELAAGDLDELDNTFAGIDSLEPAAAPDDWRSLPDRRTLHLLGAARHLQLGGVGLGEERRGGLLVLGSQSSRVTLPPIPAAGARLRVRTENYSNSDARFLVAHERGEAEWTLSPWTDVWQEVSLEAGERELRLEVEGEEEGVFLWGAPHLEGLGRELPPILLVTLDTTRRDSLHPYDPGAPPMPAVERLAARGTVFEAAFTTSPWTLPAHASMMTGLYPSRHGAGVTSDRLPVPSVTLASLLRRRGYLTAGFAGGVLSAHDFGIGHGMSLYRNPDGFETRGDRLTDRVKEFLDRFGEEPFFLFVNYFDPHDPYRAPERYRGLLGVDELAGRLRSRPGWSDILDGKTGTQDRLNRGEIEVDGDGRELLRRLYLAEVAFVDAQLARLFELLDDRGRFDEALIVLVGDHGELLGEEGRFGHSYRLDGALVETPLIVKWPQQTEPRRISDLVSVVDLFPTLLAAAGIDPPPSDGRHLGPEGVLGERRRQVLFEEHANAVHPLDGPLFVAPHLYGVERRDFRQVVWQGGQECARRNGAEWRPVPCRGSPDAVLAELIERLGSRLPSSGGAGTGAGLELSPERRQQLEALGYL